jgi:hypothetical protein
VHRVRSPWSPDSQGAMHLARGSCTPLGRRSEIGVKAQRTPSLSRRQHHGANSVASEVRAIFTTASQLPSAVVPASRFAASAQHGRAASFRAGLRSSLTESGALRPRRHHRLRSKVALLFNRSAPARIQGSQFRGCPLPNNTLVRTAQTQARLGLRAASGAATAQRGRSVSNHD